MAGLSLEQKRALAMAKAKAAASVQKYPLMGQLNKGISESVGGLVDFINPFDEYTGSAVTGMENAMHSVGVETANRPPEGAVEGAFRGAGHAAGSLIPVAKGLQALRGAGGAVGAFADDAYMAINSAMGASTEVVAGGLSGGAKESARQAGAPEWVQNTLAVAAPMAIPGVAAIAKGAAQISPVGIAARRVAATMAPYTKSGAKQVAQDRMQGLAGGRERADELAGRITEENPLSLSPAQQTGDPNMLAVEKLAASQDPNLNDAITSGRVASSDAARDAVGDMGGDFESAKKFFELRRKNYSAILKSQADGVMASADDRIRGVTGTKGNSENSVIVSRKINEALKNWTAKEQSLWDAIPMGETAGTSISKARAQALVDGTAFAQRDDIPRAVNDLLNNPEVYGDEATIHQMHGMYSELRRVARSAMSGNDQNKNRARIANDVADAILEDIGAKAGTTETGRLINEARAYSAALHETFDRGAVGRLLKRTIDGDASIDPEVALKRTVGRGAEEGFVSSRQIEDAAPTARSEIEDYIAGQFSKSAVSDKNGEITMGNARAFMNKNKELLSRYPELRAEIEGAVAQRETAEQLSARITRRIGVLEDARRSSVARFIGESSDKAISAVFEAKNPIRAARLLKAEASRDPSGKAVDGVKSVFTDYLINGAMTTKGDVTTLSASRLNGALSDPKLNRALGQIFNEGEMSRLRYIGKELAKSQATTGANIGDDLSGATANRVIEYVSRVIAARQGAQMGGGSGGSIQTAHMASSRVKAILGHLASDKASQMIADAVTDPELFKALLTQTGSAKALDRAIPKFIPYLVGGVAAAGHDGQGAENVR